MVSTHRNRLKKSNSAGAIDSYYSKSGVGKRILPRIKGFLFRRFTIMLVPHSGRKPINFQVSLISCFTSVAIFFLVITGFFTFAVRYSKERSDSTIASRNLEASEAGFELLTSELKNLLFTGQTFSAVLNDTLDALNIERDDDLRLTDNTGDLSSIVDMEHNEDGGLSEITKIRHLTKMMENSADELEKVDDILKKQEKFLTEIPSLWPVQGGLGWVAASFGPTIHPFQFRWYMHRGIDICHGMGTPLLATAGGKIIEVGFDRTGYGNFVVIKHKYGFYTRYAHLQRVYVDEGDRVEQGHVIGALGSTGNSTGPHVHYEVRIGSQLVDPAIFLDMSGQTNKRKTFDKLSFEMKTKMKDNEVGVRGLENIEE